MDGKSQDYEESLSGNPWVAKDMQSVREPKQAKSYIPVGVTVYSVFSFAPKEH